MASTEKLPPGKLDYYDGFAPVITTWTEMVKDFYLNFLPVSQVMDKYTQQVLQGIRSVVGD
jgi:hypothetical protein